MDEQHLQQEAVKYLETNNLVNIYRNEGYIIEIDVIDQKSEGNYQIGHIPEFTYTVYIYKPNEEDYDWNHSVDTIQEAHKRIEAYLLRGNRGVPVIG